MDRVVELAKRHGLFLIEDCAHAHSSEWRGRRVGGFGAASAFSFQSSKLITAGEGGMIITNDDEVERLARSVHDCGRMPGEWTATLSMVPITGSASGKALCSPCNSRAWISRLSTGKRTHPCSIDCWERLKA